MGYYILRRLGQSVLTVLGVMLITFLLFRVVSGDIAAANLGPKATARQRADWNHNYGYDRPPLVNYHRRLMILDQTDGPTPLGVRDPAGSLLSANLDLVLAGASDRDAPREAASHQKVLIGRYVGLLDGQTSIKNLLGGKNSVEARPKTQDVTTAPAAGPGAAETTGGTAANNAAVAPESAPAAAPESAPAAAPESAAAVAPESAPAVAPAAGEEAPAEPAGPVYQPVMVFSLSDGSTLKLNATGARTAGELIAAINNHPRNRGRVRAGIAEWAGPFNSQFFHHLWSSITFSARSLRDNRTLPAIIRQHAPASLAVQVPALALEWVIGLVIACFVAYYRGTVWDKLGVFLSVLGMCIPFLAWMMYGQALMFWLSPPHAYGTFYRVNLYVPVAIMVAAGLGGMVRFYRTVILDETNRDYVRTALARACRCPACSSSTC